MKKWIFMYVLQNINSFMKRYWCLECQKKGLKFNICKSSWVVLFFSFDIKLFYSFILIFHLHILCVMKNVLHHIHKDYNKTNNVNLNFNIQRSLLRFKTMFAILQKKEIKFRINNIFTFNAKLTFIWPLMLWKEKIVIYYLRTYISIKIIK